MNSGWTTLIENTGVTSSGVAQPLLSGRDVVRTKYSHQVTACILITLTHKDYNHYETTTSLAEGLHSSTCNTLDSNIGQLP